ncbi:MAG: hypothetical protein MK110_10295, partial [Fuerstiella sp.]|nr:hypothetical protein [Fuerstiella sp.]
AMGNFPGRVTRGGAGLPMGNFPGRVTRGGAGLPMGNFPGSVVRFDLGFCTRVRFETLVCPGGGG